MEMLLRATGLGLLLVLAAASVADAAESICPGESGARADIAWCTDFETTTGCTTGIEDACWSNNGYNDASYHAWRIVSGKSDAAVGSGYATLSGEPGTTGAGPGPGKEPLPTSRFNAVTWRWYMRFSDGFVSMASGHGPEMNPAVDPLPGTIVGVKFQNSSYSGQIHYDGIAGCNGSQDPEGQTMTGFDSLTLTPTEGNWTPLLNNQWYRLELQAVLDTACSNHATMPWSGCNGAIRMWKDGILTHKYTGRNLGHLQCTLSFYSGNPLQAYVHFEYPAWRGSISVDNVVMSNMSGVTPTDTEVIGAAAGEYPHGRGAGDTGSPYANIAPLLAWRGRHTGEDCSYNGYLGPYVAKKYRNGGALDPTRTKGTIADGCIDKHPISWLADNLSARLLSEGETAPVLMSVKDGQSTSDCSAGGGSTVHYCRWTGSAWEASPDSDYALKINLTNATDGGGVYWERQDSYGFPQWAQHGWVYLPSTNTYTVTNLALAGFTSSATNPAYGYVSFSVSGGNWSVEMKSGAGVPGSLVSGTAATLDTWHEYELILWNNGSHGCANANGCVTLMIDRTRLYNTQALPQSAAWAFTGSEPVFVVGVIDFQGTPPFQIWFDDQTITSVSAWSTDGWGTSSPFGGGIATTLSHGVRLGRGVTVH